MEITFYSTRSVVIVLIASITTNIFDQITLMPYLKTKQLAAVYFC